MSATFNTQGAKLEAAPSVVKVYNFAVTGTGTAVRIPGLSRFGLQVTGVGGSATTWNVSVEVSNDGANWTSVKTHVTSDGDGTVLFTGGNNYPGAWARCNCTSLTLGPASSINATMVAAQ